MTTHDAPQILRRLREGLQRSRVVRRVLVVSICLAAVFAGFCFHYRLGPVEFARHGSRFLASEILTWYYSDDLEHARELASAYRVGPPELKGRNPRTSWRELAMQEPALEIVPGEPWTDPSAVPNVFVYEPVDAPHLVRLLERYDLRAIVGLRDGAIEESSRAEYEAMLKLGEWIGTRWHHGADPVPDARSGDEVVDIIQAGEDGARFWCEIAARVTVHAATALGWPARLVTASRDGYTWEHAVAELWSNQHRKWFVLDTDFNVVFLADGIPLSAFELCHRGPDLRRAGRLRALPIAPFKQGLKRRADLVEYLLPFYSYVHVDLRNDWLSRPLRRGSPAGGDRATWWTAREAIGDILTAKVRVDDETRFDWAVNLVGIHAVSLEYARGGCVIEFALSGYAPYFQSFETSVDGAPFEETPQTGKTPRLTSGQHRIRARIRTAGGWRGPTSVVAFRLSAPPD